PLSRIVPGCGTPGSKATPGSKSFPASRATGCRVSPAPRTSPATHRLRPHLRFVSTPPVTPPKLRLPSTDITDSDPELAALLRPRRRALHAVIAGIVVAGVVIGLAVGGLFQDGEDRTAVARPVAAPPSTDTTSAASTAETSTAAASTSDGSMTGAFASPTVVDSTSQTDRTVERASAHEAAVATKPAIPSAPTAGIRAETTRSSAVADTKSGAPARPVVETRSDPAETPSVDSASAADDKAADSERVATSEAGKPALEVKPELAKPDVPKPELGKRASARVASGAATRPSERSRTSKSGDSKPVVSPSEAESSGKSDRGMVTSLKKPDADKKSDTDAPKSGASSSASSTPTPSRPSAPSNPSPSRPSPSNEDLYDTR
ncbi:MAG TPA: hypothetical protein VLM79_17835, partial [Kofleriaceae bacterium]|nr:hypothetical protein [Kofleriaceae bacterium]